MPKVNRDHLFRYSVWLPSIEEQAEIASKIDVVSAETRSLEVLYQRKLAHLIHGIGRCGYIAV